MIYALHKFRKYLLVIPFIFYTNHMALKYLINKTVLQGRICKWVLLFEEFEFAVVVKPGKSNLGLHHLSRIDSGEDIESIVHTMSYAQLFILQRAPSELEDIFLFLKIGMASEQMNTLERK